MSLSAVTIPNSSGKVMFSQACVKNSVHRGRMFRQSSPWVDTPLDRHNPGQTPPRQTPPPEQTPPWTDPTSPPHWTDPLPGRRPLQQTVHILLECILVTLCDGQAYGRRCFWIISNMDYYANSLPFYRMPTYGTNFTERLALWYWYSLMLLLITISSCV